MIENRDNLPELPKSSTWTRVQEVIQIIDYRGRTPPFISNGIPHLRSSNIKNGRIIWEDLSVAACNQKAPGLQTRQFSAHNKCN